jgi:hypothetical protein
MFSVAKRYGYQKFSIATRFTTTKMGPVSIIPKLDLGGKNVFNLA